MPLVKIIVVASRQFLTAARDVGASRFCALRYIDKKRRRHPFIWISVADAPLTESSLDLDMLATSIFSVASDWGTMASWQSDAARIVAKICIMQAWRSVLIIDGNTSAASTRAFSDVLTRLIASPFI